MGPNLSSAGRHSGEDIEKGEWEKVWLELGISDQSATLTHLAEISALCTATLQSTSWNNRIQVSTIYYLLFTIYYLLFTIYYLLFTIYHLLFTIYYLLFTIYYLLQCSIYYVLFTTI